MSKFGLAVNDGEIRAHPFLSVMRYSIARTILLLVTALMVVASCSDDRQGKLPSEVILFLGDSITEEGFFVTDIDEAINRESTNFYFRVINGGRGSETVSGLTESNFRGSRPYLFSRLNKVLRRTRPDWVVAFYGINCGIFQPFDNKRFEAYQEGIKKLVEAVRASGSRLILLTPPPYANQGPVPPEGTNAVAREEFLDEANRNALEKLGRNPNRYGYRSQYPYYDHVMDKYATWLKSLDKQGDVRVIDVREAMLHRIEECYDKDPVHPNRTGHRVIAEAFLLEWPGIVGEARATAGDADR